MKYFLGTHEAKFLSGAQLALPSKVRKVLDSKEIIISTGFDVCIFGFDPETWQRTVVSGLENPLYDPAGRKIRRELFANAEVIRMDGQGRFVVPPMLRNYAQLKEELLIIGAGDHFEIWSKEEWAKQSKEQS